MKLEQFVVVGAVGIMRQVMSWAGVLAVLAAVLAGPGQARAAEPARMALVIGNSVYAGLPPLPGCAASMNVVSAALKRAGFTVTEQLNPSNGAMGASIGAFGDAVASSPGAVAATYFCGYATELDGRVFLLPASVRLERETDALTQGLVARLLTSSMAGPQLLTGAVLLDTVAVPGKGAAPGQDGLTAGLPDAVGLAAAHSRALQAGGPSPLAAAAAAALGAPDVETRTMLQDMRLSLEGSSGMTATVRPPERAGWLVGHAPAVPAPVVPAVVAAPAVAAAPASPASPAVAPAPGLAAVSDGPAPGTVAVLDEAGRRQVQTALQKLGYYAGRVDGAFGPETIAAIRRFQHELAAEMTGRLTLEQMSRLLDGTR
jgi:hypothetical protein